MSLIIQPIKIKCPKLSKLRSLRKKENKKYQAFFVRRMYVIERDIFHSPDTKEERTTNRLHNFS